MEVSTIASMMALLREGHLNSVFKMISFLKSDHNSTTVCESTSPEIDQTQFLTEAWSENPYGPCKKDTPSNAPSPRGIRFTMRAFVNSDHAGASVTRRSRTDFIVFLNSDPSLVYSKNQGSCETSSFGSEFIAIKSFCKNLRGLHCKLRMFRITVEYPAYLFEDNQFILTNSCNPHSILKNKSSSIACQFSREGVAKEEWRNSHLNTHLDPSGVCTKSLPSGEKKTCFVGYFLRYLY